MALGTFKIDDELWQQFQQKAKANGSNASAVLKDFIRQYVSGEDTDLQLEKRVELLEQRLGELSAA